MVGIWQLKSAGYSQDQVDQRVRTGQLHRLYRGSYAVGHCRLSAKGRRMAAVLACGPLAVLSHGSAAAMWELRPPPAGPVHVTAGRTKKGQVGIRLHSTRRLHPHDRTIIDGIPVTSVHRTLLDYAEVARTQELRHAVEEAERRELFDGRALEALLERSRGRRGVKPLESVLAQLHGAVPWTRSELERVFLALIRDSAIPEPQANVFVEGELVDFFWPEQRVVVEIDSYGWHRSRTQFENDRRRDAKLLLVGIPTLRLTQRRLERETGDVVSDVLQILAAASGR